MKLQYLGPGLITARISSQNYDYRKSCFSLLPCSEVSILSFLSGSPFRTYLLQPPFRNILILSHAEDTVHAFNNSSINIISIALTMLPPLTLFHIVSSVITNVISRFMTHPESRTTFRSFVIQKSLKSRIITYTKTCNSFCSSFRLLLNSENSNSHVESACFGQLRHYNSSFSVVFLNQNMTFPSAEQLFPCFLYPSNRSAISPCSVNARAPFASDERIGAPAGFSPVTAPMPISIAKPDGVTISPS